MSDVVEIRPRIVATMHEIKSQPQFGRCTRCGFQGELGDANECPGCGMKPDDKMLTDGPTKKEVNHGSV